MKSYLYFYFILGIEIMYSNYLSSDESHFLLIHM